MSHPPPVPPANRSDKGPGEATPTPEEARAPQPPTNSDERGQQGNVKQNTTNTGYQQDR